VKQLSASQCAAIFEELAASVDDETLSRWRLVIRGFRQAWHEIGRDHPFFVAAIRNERKFLYAPWLAAANLAGVTYQNFRSQGAYALQAREHFALLRRRAEALSAAERERIDREHGILLNGIALGRGLEPTAEHREWLTRELEEWAARQEWEPLCEEPPELEPLAPAKSDLLALAGRTGIALEQAQRITRRVRADVAGLKGHEQIREELVRNLDAFTQLEPALERLDAALRHAASLVSHQRSAIEAPGEVGVEEIEVLATLIAKIEQAHAGAQAGLGRALADSNVQELLDTEPGWAGREVEPQFERLQIEGLRPLADELAHAVRELVGWQQAFAGRELDRPGELQAPAIGV
jgi:hypothetical protein